MSNDHDIARAPESIGEEELVAAIQDDRQAMDPLVALKELVHRKSARVTPVLSAVVAEPRFPTDMRTAAAVELGKEVRPEHQRALIAGLRAGEPRVVRRTAEALGRIGDHEALEALQTLPLPSDPVAVRSITFARSLIAYRLGLGTQPIQPPQPADVLNLGETKAATLRPAPINDDLMKRIAPRLRTELPAIPVALQRGIRLTCAGNAFVLLPHEQASEMSKSSFVPAVVLKRSHSLGHFTLHLYILTHPVKEGTLALFGVRPDGIVTYTGEVRVADPVFHFRVEALNTPYSPPVDVEGSFTPRDQRIEFKKALVSPTLASSQRRARVPQKDFSGRVKDILPP